MNQTGTTNEARRVVRRFAASVRRTEDSLRLERLISRAALTMRSSEIAAALSRSLLDTLEELELERAFSERKQRSTSA